MTQTFLQAIALVFILEGLLPFIAPDVWRKSMLQLMSQPNRVLRIFGMISMLLGLGLLYLFH